jgi:hypothetical protein
VARQSRGDPRAARRAAPTGDRKCRAGTRRSSWDDIELGSRLVWRSGARRHGAPRRHDGCYLDCSWGGPDGAGCSCRSPARDDRRHLRRAGSWLGRVRPLLRATRGDRHRADRRARRPIATRRRAGDRGEWQAGRELVCVLVSHDHVAARPEGEADDHPAARRSADNTGRLRQSAATVPSPVARLNLGIRFARPSPARTGSACTVGVARSRRTYRSAAAPSQFGSPPLPGGGRSSRRPRCVCDIECCSPPQRQSEHSRCSLLPARYSYSCQLANARNDLRRCRLRALLDRRSRGVDRVERTRPRRSRARCRG